MEQHLDIIDADGHITEPGDLWERYIDPEFREHCPKIWIEADGTEKMRIDEGIIVGSKPRLKKSSLATASHFGGRDRQMDISLNYLEGAPGGFDPHARIAWMDQEGIDAAILFPTMALNTMFYARDPRRTAAVTEAYNRYMADFAAPYKDRLLPVGLLPLCALDEAIAQVVRCKKAGINSGCVRPNLTDGKPLHHPDFYPLWQACQDNDFGVAVHGSAGVDNIGLERFGRFSSISTNFGDDEASYAVEHCFVHTAEMMAAVTSFVLAGICERFPRLKVAFIEGGGAWLPGYVDRMDRHFDDISANDLCLTVRPSEIFERQCVAAFEPVEGSIKVLAEYFGPSKLMVATDYPHGDGFPNTVAKIKAMNFKPEVERALFSAGAKEWYGVSAIGRAAPQLAQ